LEHVLQLHRHFTGDNLSARTVSDKLIPVHLFLSTGCLEHCGLWELFRPLATLSRSG
jgi:hypothetical protein